MPDTASGFPGYCTSSLLTMPPSNTLTEYRASRYFARLPTCTAEAGSLALRTVNLLWLPSDPAVGQWRPYQSDCLPLSRGDATFFQVTGFAGFAGQTKKAGKAPAKSVIETAPKHLHSHFTATRRALELEGGTRLKTTCIVGDPIHLLDLSVLVLKAN